MYACKNVFCLCDVCVVRITVLHKGRPCQCVQSVHICVTVSMRLLRAAIGKGRGQDGGISRAMLSTGCRACVRVCACERNRDTCLDVQAEARGFYMR